MATKGVVNSLFGAIRKGDEAQVRRMVEGEAELVNARRVGPPKKDDGQSALQVACKVGQFAIAQWLIERGADVNYIEESSVNEWRTPVLHDAIRAAVFSTRSAVGGSERSFTTAMNLVRRMLEKGADPKGRDSYGNSCLHRALMDLRQVLIAAGGQDKAEAPGNRAFDEDARALLEALLGAGADVHAGSGDRDAVMADVKGRYFERFFSG